MFRLTLQIGYSNIWRISSVPLPNCSRKVQNVSHRSDGTDNNDEQPGDRLNRRLLTMIEKKDQMLFETIKEKDQMLFEMIKEKEQIIERLSETKLHLKENEFCLKEVTVAYLQAYSSMNERSVFEIFQNRYVKPKKGQEIAMWNDFIHSKTAVAKSVKMELEEKEIDVQKLGRLVTNLYSTLSKEIHKSVKSNTAVYLLKDALTGDEMVFLKAIAKHIVNSHLLKEISVAEWKELLLDLSNDRQTQ